MARRANHRPAASGPPREAGDTEGPRALECHGATANRRASLLADGTDISHRCKQQCSFLSSVPAAVTAGRSELLPPNLEGRRGGRGELESDGRMLRSRGDFGSAGAVVGST